ncbi:GTPase domain-containing protein [Lautropia mirabilis]
MGEVRDEPHVTDTNDRFELAQTPQGDQLVLWDTPGFGDSARLARRLLQSDRPIGWFVSQVWDRFADRALWSSQQAVHNVREEADVVLYLVNAAENPEDAGYVEPEMKILAWIGKPIIVLLNQMGPPAGHRPKKPRSIAGAPTSPASATSIRCWRWMPLPAAGSRKAPCCRPSSRCCCRPRSPPSAD